MKVIKVDDFKGLNCSYCNKSLEQEQRIVKDENTFGVYWCCKCYENRRKARVIANFGHIIS